MDATIEKLEGSLMRQRENEIANTDNALAVFKSEMT